MAETDLALLHRFSSCGDAQALPYAAFERINPRLIYLATYGYRADGPMGGKAAYDDIIQAGSGLTILQTVVAGEPRFLPTIVADKTSSNGVVSAVLAGLYEREKSGRGQWLVMAA